MLQAKKNRYLIPFKSVLSPQGIHTHFQPQASKLCGLRLCLCQVVRRLSPLDRILIGKLDQHCRPINTPSLLSPTQLVEEDNSMSVLKAV